MAENRPTPRERRKPFARVHRLRYRHGPHLWTFTFTVGDEQTMLDRIDELARDGEAPLDRFDASIVREHLMRLVRRTPASTTNSNRAARRTATGGDFDPPD
jgi:hypothetical protein